MVGIQGKEGMGSFYRPRGRLPIGCDGMSKSDKTDGTIGFIGSGRMARAMVTGLLRSGARKPEALRCTSAADGTGEALAADTGIRWEPEVEPLIAASDIVVLAMKPQQLADFPVALGERAEGRLVLSILAGTSLSVLAERFPVARNIIRIMPNTPGAIGAGISGWCYQRVPEPGDRESVGQLLQSLGRAVEVEEKDMDAVTAVSGSGPAYVFEMAASLVAAALKEGLSEEVAKELVLHTLLGASRLLVESGRDPELLRNDVTSPGGTTQAALEEMKEADFRGLMQRAVSAARRRSEELSGS